MTWARSALERNKDLEVVAVDEGSHTFTVRLRGSNELQKVRADELIVTFVGAPTAVTAAAAPAPQPVPAEAAQAQAPAVAGEAATADTSAPAEEAAPAAASVAPPEAPGGGRVLSAGPGYTIKASGGSAGATKLASGQLSESGPGYSIKSSAGATGAPRARESGASTAALERRHEPIVCQGSRLLQIDNRNLQFDGDAVSAEDGCEIHITNSHITAGGVGVQARAANVHIDNSSIEGNTASIDASDGAQVYAAGSHFTGMSRQLDTASFHDLGGNIWN
jgi:hypothetical protein